MSEQVDQIALRRNKLAQLRQGGKPFPNDFRRDAYAGDLQNQYADTEFSENQVPIHVKVSGRLMTRRLMGKASFTHIQDSTGQIQLFLQKDQLGESIYDEFKNFDIGDILGAEGDLFRTRTGELSIRVKNIRLLTKALRPLPEKYHGLTDPEIRYRQRYLDLLMNDTTRSVFLTRAAIIQHIREFMISHRYLEVETPMMHPIPGGAVARPFITHHNTLNMDLYLRVAPELYLKKLVVGGFERVFEINRNFRNEGISTRHNPEFTMMEFYCAYADYHDFIDLTEELVKSLCQKVIGREQLNYQGQEIDFSGKFECYDMLQSILRFNPDISRKDLHDERAIRELANHLQIQVGSTDGIGKIQMEIFEKKVEQKLINPTFITGYPVEVSPLSRRNDKQPDISDRFEFFIAGREIANGFSELNDAEDQAERFQEQVNKKDAGDHEAMHFDADYICALEHGLPPTAGEGIGIDRLVMILTDSPSIRDVVLFPHLRHQQPPAE
ncbi:MAG: lysine--tRNA ligase [Gammaproteobacteria bacterium]|nr:lysine--tRNA ligase [Gammaproteobacteria bacterium]MCY4219494.1 lysine--tRNA ligase [Gammaproteobacteria bacterium]MCY4275219.1 lysine--tRNA ligase [Gammaproteobacteria bacterium]